jgi:hypothetical protein
LRLPDFHTTGTWKWRGFSPSYWLLLPPGNIPGTRSRNNQHYTLICSTPLFYILAPTCFGTSLTSSGSFLDPSELLEIQIE